MKHTTTIFTLALAAMTMFAIESQGQDRPLMTKEQHERIDSMQVEMQNDQAEWQKDQDKSNLADAKRSKRETKANAKEARRIESEANEAARDSRNAYRTEKKAQKARRNADKQAERAVDSKRKSDRN